ncbi:Substance-K receptor, partial [Stegodyphus mimosarum]
MAIMFPLHVRITKQRTSIVMKIIWLISILVSIPFLIFKIHEVESYIDFTVAKCREQWPLNIYYDESIGSCSYEETLRKIYYVVVSVTLYFLPIGIMITAYSLILWKLWISEVPGERHAANINVQYRARKKVIKMVCVVLVAFIVCWTPFQVVVLHSAYSSIDYVAPVWMDSFVWFAYYIAFANSFINPIIYGGFNKSFREGFCVVLRCGIRPGRFTGPRADNNSRITNT